MMSWAGSYLGMLGLLKEAAIGGVMGGLAGTAFYGAGKAFGFLKDSVKDVWGEGRSVKYSPINPCDEINKEIAESFNGATFTKKVLTEDTVMYRVSGGNAGTVGSYMSRIPQNGGL